MQTVQLQCGNCSNMMAISVEHLGAQVQCPHCAAVVQTPPRSSLGPLPGPDPSPPSPPAPPPPPPVRPPEQESIFSEPEPSDDLFGGGGGSPKVEMPEPAYGQNTRYASSPQPAYTEAAVAVEEPDDEPHADLSAMRSRLAAERKSSSFAPTLLVFLVPYAIFTSAFVAYLLLTWPKIEHLDWLPDPNNKKAPKVVVLPVHDLKLAASRKFPLGASVRIGDMEITPLKVDLDRDVLTLRFKAKNLSTNHAIEPIDPGFFFEGKAGSARPFTFLEALGRDQRIYGGDLEFFDEQNRRRADGLLMPGQECIVTLSTDSGAKMKERVHNMVAGDGRFLWRLQFRRGMHPVHGVETSLSAVIGVEFNKNDITRG